MDWVGASRRGIRAAQQDVPSMPKDQELDARSPGWRPDLRGVLVIGQVSLSLVLLIGGGLSLKSLLNARALDVGLARDHRLLISLDPGLPG